MAGNISKIECSICKLCLSWLKPTASDKIMDGRTETGIRLLYITCSQLQLTETEAAIHQLMRMKGLAIIIISLAVSFS